MIGCTISKCHKPVKYLCNCFTTAYFCSDHIHNHLTPPHQLTPLSIAIPKEDKQKVIKHILYKKRKVSEWQESIIYEANLAINYIESTLKSTLLSFRAINKRYDDLIKKIIRTEDIQTQNQNKLDESLIDVSMNEINFQNIDISSKHFEACLPKVLMTPFDSWILKNFLKEIEDFIGKEENSPARINKNSAKIVVKSYEDGEYKGEVKNGKRHGFGKFIWNNGSWYEGEWRNDLRDGEGITCFANGNIYEGEYKLDKKNGKGKFIWADGSRCHGDCYEGEFFDDAKNGFGVYYFSHGFIYEGEFKNNLRNGKGKIIWADNDTYEGNFKNGVFDGFGVRKYQTGEVYEGNWSQGKRNGKGKSIYIDGRIIEGVWIDDKMIDLPNHY
ncbi:unnamed protein product [Blepharisma stoltei]|uniref:MORN repeat protein n=1 Tax=Blepharisma stoltei TaxID=1481888 RepID=A0AAU9K9M7_9CILI|nr:unnamed protein product [Blepharisma stoltei]